MTNLNMTSFTQLPSLNRPMPTKTNKGENAAHEMREFFCSALGESFTKMLQTESFEQEMMNSIHLKKVITDAFVEAGIGEPIEEGVKESLHLNGAPQSPYPPSAVLSYSSQAPGSSAVPPQQEYIPDEMLQAEQWGC